MKRRPGGDGVEDECVRKPEIVCTVPDNVRAKLRLHSQEPSETLELDGTAVLVRSVNEWLETALQPGKHTIKFRA